MFSSSTALFVFVFLIDGIDGVVLVSRHQVKAPIDLFHRTATAEFTPKGNQQPDFDIDLTPITSRVGPNEFFNEMSSAHQTAVLKLEQVLKRFHLRSNFTQVALQLRDHSAVNPTLWVRAVLTTILHRPDRARFRIPSLIEVEPDHVLPAHVVRELVERSRALNTSTEEDSTCVTVNERFGFDNGIENKLWYFREDPMVNSHHWHWHLAHPYAVNDTTTLDRHGELFYSMHHITVARYNAERLSNDLAPVGSFSIASGEVVPDGYNPHLTDLNSNNMWTPRPPNRSLATWVFVHGQNISLEAATEWHTTLRGAIYDGYLVALNGSKVSLNNQQGIDVLSNAMEASVNSLNHPLYGRLGYHNSGHSFIGNAVAHFDETVPNSPNGVMSGTVASLRDPIFYKWHQHVDELYTRHKYTLESYPYNQPAADVNGDEELAKLALHWPGVEVEEIEVKTGLLDPANKLTTFWTHTTYDLTNGLDFKRNASQGQGKIHVCVKHLDHKKFMYRIRIKNSNHAATAIVRIFLAPRYRLDGTRYTILEQHTLFFPLDTFQVNLNSGNNLITRSSTASTTTISHSQGLAELNGDQARTKAYCGCGWPNYMLLPKGKSDPSGMVFDLFVMATMEPAGPSSRIPKNEDDDLDLGRQFRRVGSNGHSLAVCQEAYLMCGKRGEKFPDSKPMLYPFDRRPPAHNDVDGRAGVQVEYLEDFISGVSNMESVQITITHLDDE